ncbi:MAG: transmembrane 220 family protein [Bacteroidetes bacterium]|nr:transmembrane 220 family protein [Bacteroidota bacterium]
MRYIALLFSFIYLLFAYWQINDPDPIWWVALYLISATISFRTFKDKYSQEVLIVLSILYLAYAINSFQQITKYEGFFSDDGGLSMKTINQELARETAGLFICVFTFITYSVYFFAKEKKGIK